MLSSLLYVLYWIIQLTWGCIQTAMGFVVFLWCYADKHYFYHGAIATEWKYGGGVSLGAFIFAQSGESTKWMMNHEYGHSVQSIILGPLYLPLIGIPSFIWCNLPFFKNRRISRKIPYNDFYTEKWATHLGEKHSQGRFSQRNLP